MSNMQIVFTVIGLILILAIIGHGMWTIRKNERRDSDRAAALERKRQKADGFDDDGVGPVRVIKRTDSGVKATATPSSGQMTSAPSAAEAEAPDLASAAERAHATDTPTETVPKHDDVVSTPAMRATDDIPESIPSITATPSQTQMDLTVERKPDEKILTEEPEEVIVLHVTGNFEGAILLQQMTELGFKYGDFDIFHRHVDTAGNGPVLFSLANMFNPGTFDIDHMETFQTDGVALFLALPIKGDSKQAFTMMHNAAVKLAAAVESGHVLDEHRNPLTRQSVQHIHQRIREFERKRLIRQ
ncbi:MAG TPA: cell division protein ZipA [Pseudidiomarina sp.]|nr:cell division protein ZipA [Pseudidiomarina sp.]